VRAASAMTRRDVFAESHPSPEAFGFDLSRIRLRPKAGFGGHKRGEVTRDCPRRPTQNHHVRFNLNPSRSSESRGARIVTQMNTVIGPFSSSSGL